jgi:hypothetical protein
MAEYSPLPGTTEHGDLRRKQIGCICALLGSIAVLLAVTAYTCLFHTVPLRVSKETTYITEPLKPDGKQVDYLAAWERQTYPENIATEENGYRLIVQHLGTAPEATPAHAAQIIRKLGLAEAEIQPDMTIEEPWDYLKGHVANQDLDEALTEELASANAPPRDPLAVLEDRLDRPWTLDDLPMMEAWLAENGPAIDLVGEAVRKPTFHIPLAAEGDLGQLIDLPLPELQWTRSFARALSARAYYRIGTGDIDGAIDDVMSCKRLGRNVGQEGPLEQVYGGIAIEGIADAIGIAGSPEHPPSKQQLERLVDETNDLPPRSEFEKSLLFDRYVALDLVQAMAHGKRPVNMDSPLELRTALALNWNIVAIRVNECFDGLSGAGAYPQPSRKLAAIVSRRARSGLMADKLGGFFLTGSHAVRGVWRRATCVERIQHITLAMLLYERDHGRLPPAYTVDADGKPMHSWRVLLLPYLGQQRLYDKIRLDEPWDGQHNRQFHNEAVPFYQCPSAELAPGQTTYSVVVGENTAFHAGEGKSLDALGMNLLLVTEREQSAGWMDPTSELAETVAIEAINRQEGKAVGIGSPHPGGVNAGFRDASARFISETIEPSLLQRLLDGTAEECP